MPTAEAVVVVPSAGRRSDGPPSTTASQQRNSRISWVVVVGCAVALVTPLLVAAIALRRPAWFPVLDLAMTELRVRDVGTPRTPLIGLPGRIGRTLADQGSHPGPLSFYLLAPIYRMFGASAWAMQAATAALHAAAMVVALLIARRRGGVPLVLAVGVMLAVLTRGYGPSTLTEPWNPYLPLLWWVVFLLAVWSVVIGDVRMLPVAVFAGSVGAQTHVPYVALTLGLGGIAMGAALVAFVGSARGSRTRRTFVVWTALAAVVGLALWTPPVVDELTSGDGNLAKLVEHFTDTPQEPVGLAKGVELALLHLDVSGIVSRQGGTSGPLVTATAEPDGSIVPGLLLLGVWLASAIAVATLASRQPRTTFWQRDPAVDGGIPLTKGRRIVLGLHLVVAVAVVLGTFSLSRIFGDLWYYLMLWAWGVAALLVLATVWSLVLVARHLRPDVVDRTRPVAAIVLAVVVVASAAAFTADGLDAEPPSPRLSATLGAVVGPTADALTAGIGPADGRDGRYVITWDDALHIGSQAYGLVNELERRGFTVGMTPRFAVPNTKYRTISPDDATAEVHFATGVYIEPWRERPEAIEVAWIEPRSDAEVDRFADLRRRAIDQLRAEGFDGLAPVLDENLFGVSIDRRVPRHTRELIAEMLELGLPTAVFIAPAGTTPG